MGAQAAKSGQASDTGEAVHQLGARIQILQAQAAEDPGDSKVTWRLFVGLFVGHRCIQTNVCFVLCWCVCGANPCAHPILTQAVATLVCCVGVFAAPTHVHTSS